MAGDILVAKQTAVLVYDGRQITITGGRTTVRAGHPILDGREQMFEPIRIDFDVEQPAEPKQAAAKPATTRRKKT